MKSAETRLKSRAARSRPARAVAGSQERPSRRSTPASRLCTPRLMRLTPRPRQARATSSVRDSGLASAVNSRSSATVMVPTVPAIMTSARSGSSCEGVPPPR